MLRDTIFKVPASGPNIPGHTVRTLIHKQLSSINELVKILDLNREPMVFLFTKVNPKFTSGIVFLRKLDKVFLNR